MGSKNHYDKYYDSEVKIEVYGKDELLLSIHSKVRELGSNVSYLLSLGYNFKIINV